MASKKGAEALALIRSTLQKNRGATYAEIKAQAEKKGYTIHPIMYGRAQALEGIVKSRPRGSAKKAAARGPGRPPKRGPGRPPKRGPGRPPKRREDTVALASIENVIRTMRENQAQLERYRRVIEQVQRALESVS